MQPQTSTMSTKKHGKRSHEDRQVGGVSMHLWPHTWSPCHFYWWTKRRNKSQYKRAWTSSLSIQHRQFDSITPRKSYKRRGKETNVRKIMFIARTLAWREKRNTYCGELRDLFNSFYLFFLSSLLFSLPPFFLHSFLPYFLPSSFFSSFLPPFSFSLAIFMQLLWQLHWRLVEVPPFVPELSL